MKYNWSYSGQLNVEYTQFAPALNSKECELYLELISMFKRRCEAFDIAYLLIAGSALLGRTVTTVSYHGMMT